MEGIPNSFPENLRYRECSLIYGQHWVLKGRLDIFEFKKVIMKILLSKWIVWSSLENLQNTNCVCMCINLKQIYVYFIYNDPIEKSYSSAARIWICCPYSLTLCHLCPCQLYAFGKLYILKLFYSLRLIREVLVFCAVTCYCITLAPDSKMFWKILENSKDKIIHYH